MEFFEEAKYKDFDLVKDIFLYKNGKLIKNIYSEYFNKASELKTINIEIDGKEYTVKYKTYVNYFKDILNKVVDIYRNTENGSINIKLDIVSQRGFINNILILLEREYSIENVNNIKNALKYTYNVSDELLEKSLPIIINYVKDEMHESVKDILKNLSGLVTKVEEDALANFLESIEEFVKEIKETKHILSKKVSGGHSLELDSGEFAGALDETRKEIKECCETLSKKIEEENEKFGLKENLESIKEDTREISKIKEDLVRVVEEIVDIKEIIKNVSAVKVEEAASEPAEKNKEELSGELSQEETELTNEQSNIDKEDDDELMSDMMAIAQEDAPEYDIYMEEEPLSEYKEDAESYGDIDIDVPALGENRDKETPIEPDVPESIFDRDVEVKEENVPANYMNAETNALLTSLGSKLEELEKKFEDIEKEVTNIEKNLADEVSERVASVIARSLSHGLAESITEKVLASFEGKIGNIAVRIEEVNNSIATRIDAIEEKVNFIYEETLEAKKIRERYLSEEDDEE